MGNGLMGKNGGVQTVLHTSVARLYSNLVTRPTGRAVRLAIEQELCEAPGPCLSILDFSRVGVLDFSCADEVVARLLSKYREPERPAEAYFLLQGVSEHHRDPIEAVLRRHRLLAVAMENGRPVLWGPAPRRLHQAWRQLDRLGRAVSDDLASVRGLSPDAAGSWLRKLASRRVAVPEEGGRFASLPALLEGDPVYRAGSASDVRHPAAAEMHGIYGEGMEIPEGPALSDNLGHADEHPGSIEAR